MYENVVRRFINVFNPLIDTLKPQSNGPSYVQYGDWYSDWYEEWTGRGCNLPRPLLAVPNVTAHPSTASVPALCYSMWHYNCLWSLKG